MDWDKDGLDWPNRALSRFAEVRPHRWHIQEAGEGPTLLLLHGAGAATQSWHGLLPRLAARFHVVAIDLPGQGFTRCGARHRLSLARMSEDIARLSEAQGWSIDLIVGHSAGAALGLDLARRLRPTGVAGLNAALGKFDGIAGWLFPLMAKLLAVNPFAATLLTRMPNGEARVRELLEATGSVFDARTLALYSRLASDRTHVAGTIGMMSQWNIDSLLGQLGAIECPVLLLAGEMDGTVSPEISKSAAARLPNGRFRVLPGLGHLMHEEAPEAVASEIEAFAEALGLLNQAMATETRRA
jgi:magnesium chelatase accessory protein